MSSAVAVEESSVEREGVVALVQPRRVAPTAPPDTLPPPIAAVPPSRAEHAFVGVLAALTSLLAARLLLLLSIAGAFVLGLLASRSGSYVALATLVAFCCLTVLPMTYLDVQTHRRGGK